MDSASVVPNWALRAAVELWRQEHGLRSLPPPKHPLVFPKLNKSRPWMSLLPFSPQMTRTGLAVILFALLGRLLAELLMRAMHGGELIQVSFLLCAVLVSGRSVSAPTWLTGGARDGRRAALR